MLYGNFLPEIMSRIKLSRDIFNPLKFNEQFLQSVYIYEEYLKKNFTGNVLMADLFSGIGTYAIFFAKYYNHIIERIYATEKNLNAYNIMKKLVKFYNYQDLIVPCAVKENVGYNPYKCKEIDKIKFELFIANPPYVPIPKNIKYPSWGNGGLLGISAVTEFLKGINKFSSEKALFGCLSYSIGRAEIEKGTIITGTLSNEFTIYNEYKTYHKLLNNQLSQWNLKFFVLNPPAWVGYDPTAKDIIIPIEKYYRYIFKENNQPILNYIKNLNEDFRFLSNIFIVGIKDENLSPYKVILKTIDDRYLNNVMNLEKKLWPENLQASRENLHSRLKYFPEGCVGAFDYNGNLVGFSTSQRVFFTPYSEIKLRKIEKWMELDNFPDSNIKETSDPRGNALHLVSACVLPEHRRKGVWQDMIIHRLRLAKFLNLDYVVILSRLNLPLKNIKLNELVDYIETNNDPNIRVLKRFGFIFNGLIKKPQDYQSAGYWVLLYKKLKSD